jgi:hypothetical protein
VRRFTQGFYGYVFAMGVCLAAVAVFLFITPQRDTEHIPSVNYTIDLANVRNAAPFAVWSPREEPAGWVPTSSRSTLEDGRVTWRLGFATARRAHAMLAQSNERPPEEFASRMANSANPAGTQQVGAESWERRVREDKNQRTLIRFLPDVTLVVTGTADWDELGALAASLTEQPRPTVSPAPSS